jgi:hypothetical protein
MVDYTNDLEAFFGLMKSQDGVIVQGLLTCYPSSSSTVIIAFPN